MIFIFGETDRIGSLVSRLYSQRFPDGSPPDERFFQKVLIRFIEIDRVNYSKHKRNKPATNEDHKLTVLLAVEEDPCRSHRQISETVVINER